MRLDDCEMDISGTSTQLARELETALSGLVKLTKALSFYPAGHPSLAAAIEEAFADFQPLLRHHNPRPYHVTREGFTLNAVPLAPGNQNLKNLALKLVERRVRHLLFLPEMLRQELVMLAEILNQPAAEILAAGGVAQQLAERQINSIWINETNLKAVLENQQQSVASNPLPGIPEVAAPQSATAPSQLPPAEPPSERPAQSESEQMRELLEQLKEPQDNETYQLLLNRARQLAPGFFKATGIVGQLTLLSLLDNQGRDQQRSVEQRQAANTATDALLTELTRRVLVDAVAEQSLKASQQRLLGRLLVSLGSKVAPQLLKRLYAERDAIIRRRYTEILARMGESIFGLLEKDLQTNTWHQARNVVNILGQSQLEAALPLLAQAIDHPDARVRRAVIRALGAIGGTQVITLLIKLAHDPDEELHQPAIMALGGLKNPRAIPPLVTMLKRRDLLGKQTALKTEVIQALATTGSPQAILPLLKLARKANLLNRKSIETLRAEAVLALGQLGNDQLIPVLKQLPRRDSSRLSKALKQATDQLKKQHNVV